MNIYQRNHGKQIVKINAMINALVQQQSIIVPSLEYDVLIIPRKRKQEYKVYYDEAIEVKEIRNKESEEME